MKVILTQDIKKLGIKGQVLEVSDGYGRNYLIPKGLAEEVTKSRLKEIEERILKAERRKNTEQINADALKNKLHGQRVSVKARTGSGDRLFGAVTAKEISAALLEEFGVTIDKKKIETGQPIKHLGRYPVKIKIYPSVQAELMLVVEPE